MPQPWREARYLHMTQMAERITKVHHQLKHDHNDPFNMNCARFFTLDANRNLSIISSCKDIYDGFEDLEKRTRSPQLVRMKYLGIETCGWAAPLNNEDDGEADEAESKRDFRPKIAICRKEAKETKYWLRMVAKAAPTHKTTARALWRETKELHLIFCAAIRTTDLNLRKERLGP